MKKLLSLLLVLCMVIGIMPVLAEEQSIPDTWQEYKGFWVEEADGAIRIMGLAVNTGGGSLIVPSEMESLTPIKIEYPFGTRYERVNMPVQLAAEAFKGVEGISKIIFEDGLKAIPVGLCKNMKGLIEVQLPKSLIAIDNYAFMGCEALEKIDLSNVQYIGRNAFEGCKSLKSVKLSNKITAIEDYAFSGCESLEKVEGLNENIRIGTDAFSGTKVNLSFDVPRVVVPGVGNYTQTDKPEQTAPTDEELEKAIKALSHLGIMTGYDDGIFKTDETLTRAEAAAIIVRLLNLENDAKQGETCFSDVPSTHWASGYIKWASENYIINGQGDGTFAPDEYVTYHQLIKMLVHTLGYDPVAMANGAWMHNGYITAAEKIALIEKEPENKDAHITRGEAAKLCYRALDIDFMYMWGGCTGMNSSAYEILEGENILTEYWKYNKIEGVIKESGGNVLIKVTKNYADKPYYVVGQVFTLEDESIREFMGSIVTAYVKKTHDGKNDIALVKLATK